MTKREIDINEYAGKITGVIRKGLLLNTKADEITDSMVIGWGTLGTNWGKPVFVTYVRESRYTRELLDKNPEFTISVPMGEINKDIFRVCGSLSGRDVDKEKEAGLTYVPSDEVSVPGVLQYPLTLECRVIYRQEQDLSIMDPDMVERMYPEAEDGSGRDAHISYYGEILKAYIIEE